ncbi:MAG: hypothetical protein ACYTHJ_06820 [Planctomycetota bacterium]|jgi:hypothetical protein
MSTCLDPTRCAAVTRGCIAIAAVLMLNGCGAFRPNDGIPDEERRSADCMDPWSLAHAAAAATLAHEFGDDSFGPTMLVMSAFEELEPVIHPWWDESLQNQRCDYLFNTLGWLVQSALE